MAFPGVTCLGLRLRQCCDGVWAPLSQRIGGWKERQSTWCPGWAQIGIAPKEGSSSQHLLIERSPGWNEPIEGYTAPAKRQRSGTQRAAASRLPLNGSCKMTCGGEQRPSGWDSHQWVHSLICLLDFLLWGSSGGNRSVHNDPEKDRKLSKALNPHWISHSIHLGYKPSKSLLLLSGRQPCLSPTLSWFLHVSSKTHWWSLF